MCWTGFLYLKKHRWHEHWVKCDFWVSKKQIFTFLKQISRFLPGWGQEEGHSEHSEASITLSCCHPCCSTWHNAIALPVDRSSFLKVWAQFVHLAEPKEDTGFQLFHAYKHQFKKHMSKAEAKHYPAIFLLAVKPTGCNTQPHPPQKEKPHAAALSWIHKKPGSFLRTPAVFPCLCIRHSYRANEPSFSPSVKID